MAARTVGWGQRRLASNTAPTVANLAINALGDATVSPATFALASAQIFEVTAGVAKSIRWGGNGLVNDGFLGNVAGNTARAYLLMFYEDTQVAFDGAATTASIVQVSGSAPVNITVHDFYNPGDGLATGSFDRTFTFTPTHTGTVRLFVRYQVFVTATNTVSADINSDSANFGSHAEVFPALSASLDFTPGLMRWGTAFSAASITGAGGSPAEYPEVLTFNMTRGAVSGSNTNEPGSFALAWDNAALSTTYKSTTIPASQSLTPSDGGHTVDNGYPAASSAITVVLTMTISALSTDLGGAALSWSHWSTVPASPGTVTTTVDANGGVQATGVRFAGAVTVDPRLTCTHLFQLDSGSAATFQTPPLAGDYLPHSRLAANIGFLSVNTRAARGVPSITEGSIIASGAGYTNTFTMGASWNSTNNLALLLVQIGSATLPITAVSSPKTSGWINLAAFADTVNGYDMEIWAAKITATGADTVTVTTVAGTSNFRGVTDQLSSGALTTWSVQASGSSTSSTSGTINFPSLTSSGLPLQAYVGIAFDNVVTSGSTAGFVYHNTSPFLNVFNGALAPNTAYQPQATATAKWSALAVIVHPGGSSVPEGVNGINVTQSLVDAAALTTPINDGGNSTALEGGENGWSATGANKLPMQWTSQLPSGQWNKSVLVNTPANITGAAYLLNSTQVLTLLAPNPSLILQLHFGPASGTETTDHWTPGVDLSVRQVFINTTSQLAVAQSSPTLTLFRWNTVTGGLEWLRPNDLTWVPVTSSLTLNAFTATTTPGFAVSATDGVSQVLTFTAATTATWTTYGLIFVVTASDAGGTPYNTVETLQAVSGSANKHSAYAFDALQFALAGAIGQK